MRARRNPKQYSPLALDPEFRYALREWERLVTATPSIGDTPQLMVQLDSMDALTRREAERRLALAVLRVLASAVGWSMRVGYASVEEEIGRNMLPVINLTTRLMKIPTTPAPVTQSRESFAATGMGQSRQLISGRILSEGVPPCWSPRWETEREVLRSYSPAQLFAGELLNHLLSLVPEFQDKARAALKKIKKQQGSVPDTALDRVMESEALAARNGLIAFFARFHAAQKDSEARSEVESQQMQKLARGIREQRDRAWSSLRSRMPPKEPKEQIDILESEFAPTAVDDYL